MQINWHYVEVALAVLVVFAVFYLIIRHNRHTDEDEIMPEIGDVDALMQTDDKADKHSKLKIKSSKVLDDDVGEVRVLSEAETKQKIEEMEKAKLQAHKSGFSSFTTKKQQKQIDHKNTYLIIHVMAQPGAAFGGYDLYQSLTSAGLTYGDMKVFHRYVEKNENSKQIMFSVASAVNPGHIDLDDIGSFNTIGLTLFMDYSRQKTASATFQLMLNTAKLLAEDLNGVLLDANRQVWCLQAENECRRRVQHYNMHLGKAISN